MYVEKHPNKRGGGRGEKMLIRHFMNVVIIAIYQSFKIYVGVSGLNTGEIFALACCVHSYFLISSLGGVAVVINFLNQKFCACLYVYIF